LEVIMVQAYRFATTLTQEGSLTLTNIPFQKGEAIEVILLRDPTMSARRQPSSLQGMVLAYQDPTEPVAQEDWEAVQ
jgi:hypothetical protein